MRNDTRTIFLTKIQQYQILAQNSYLFTTKEAKIRITFFADEIAEINIIKKKQAFFDEFSYAVIAQPINTEVILEHGEGFFAVCTQKLKIKIDIKTAHISCYDAQNTLLTQDSTDFGVVWQGEVVTNYRELKSEIHKERFIGLGEKTGGIDKKGNTYINWNTDQFAYSTDANEMYGSYPFYMGVFEETKENKNTKTQEKTTKTYGIFFDNTYKTTFNFGSMSHPFSYFRAEGGEMKYFVIGGNTPKKVLENYTFLTGRISLPPIWSLGFQQCRYSYYPESEIYNLAKTFREKKIPCDVLYLDIHYMDKYKVFTWDKNNFPNPAKLVKNLEELGFKVVLIFDPGIKVEENYKPYEDGLKKDMFVKYLKNKQDISLNYTGNVWPGACHFPDFTNEKVRDWWGENMHDLTKMGFLGFWNDMNEPAVWGKDFPDITEFHYEGQTASHRKAHNIYGMQMTRATAENAKKQANGKRPFILTRSGYSGVQRYGAVWTGDNVSEDNNMLGDIRLVNNMGLAGLSFAGYDIGGFVGEVPTKVFNKWVAYGAFSPFARCHTMINSKDAEPWAFGEETEEIARNFINLRYRLMPYLYSAFYEATQNGMPVQRSLVFEYADDPKIYEGNYQNQYFFGQSILVCAVTAHKDIHKIYLPKGTWYNMWNDEKHEGNQEIFVELPNNKIPVYVRAGEMLLLQSLTQTTQEKPSDTLEWHIYYATEGEYRLRYYEDDGTTYEYENGNERFIKKTFVYDANEQIFYIENESQKFDGKKSKKKKNGNDLPPYKSKFSKLKIYFHQFPADFIKDYYKKENYRFINPISNFDPWEHAEDMSTTLVDLAFTEVEF